LGTWRPIRHARGSLFCHSGGDKDLFPWLRRTGWSSAGNGSGNTSDGTPPRGRHTALKTPLCIRALQPLLALQRYPPFDGTQLRY
jgi:hypothetical protein